MIARLLGRGVETPKTMFLRSISQKSQKGIMILIVYLV
nr:MAG TPA: hypothetical protein [Bacteriophage sp.]